MQVQKYTEYILFQRPSIALVFNETHNMLMVCFHNKPENAFFPGKCNQRLRKESLENRQIKERLISPKGVSTCKFDLAFTSVVFTLNLYNCFILNRG